MGYTWQLKETETLESHSSVVGSTHALGQGGSVTKPRKNTVFWGLYENMQTNSGIPSFIQTAVLLKREKVEGQLLGRKFSADIKICGKVDNHKWVNDKFESFTKSMTGNSSKTADVIFNTKKNRGTVDDDKNLESVKLDTYKQLVTIRPWVDGDEKLLEQEPAPPKASEIESGGQPLSLVKPIAITMSPSINDPTIDPSIEPLARHITQDLRARGTSKESYESQVDTVPFKLADTTLVDSMSWEATSKGKAMPLSDDEKQQRSAFLDKQVSLVRNEATLVARQVALVRLERRLLQEIEELKD